MQILMSDSGYARVGERLKTMRAELDVITMDPSGALRRGSEAVDAVDAEVFWASLDMFTSRALPAFFARMLEGTKGKWVQVFSAGIDNPVFKSIMAKGIRLSKSSAQAPAIAEYVISHALSLLHPIDAQREAQEAHAWNRIFYREIASTRWLIVGFGAIGTEIANRLQPFGMHLTVVRRNPGALQHVANVRPTSDLVALLPDADVVVLACALNDETRGIAGEKFFTAMKPGSVLINIGRGGLVDEDALKSGLDRDQPARAVLDVFQTEPLPVDAWFWDHPKIRVTAHCSSIGDGVLGRGDELFLENLRRYRAGEPLLNEAGLREVGL
jgi:phosphoglycerate dehydrogenase-like enzyme